MKDRVKSAPLVAQSTKTKQDGRAKYPSIQLAAKEGEHGHPPASVSGYPATFIDKSLAGQQVSCTQASGILDSVSARSHVEYLASYPSYNGHIQ